jgi:hypothetical protein
VVSRRSDLAVVDKLLSVGRRRRAPTVTVSRSSRVGVEVGVRQVRAGDSVHTYVGVTPDACVLGRYVGVWVSG